MRVEKTGAACGCHLSGRHRQDQGRQRERQKGTFQGQFLEAMGKKNRKTAYRKAVRQ